MSIKTKKYGNVANVTVVEFGNGTLSVTNGLNENLNPDEFIEKSTLKL